MAARARKRGRTLAAELHAAVESQNYKLAEELLRAGADPNATNTLGKTSLHLAAGDLKMRRLLLGYGGDPNIETTITAQTVLDLTPLTEPLTIERTLNMLWTQLNLRARIRRRGPEWRIETAIALHDLGKDQVEALLQPPLSADDFLKQLAASYLPRIHEFVSNADSNRSRMSGAIMAKLQNEPQHHGQIVVAMKSYTLPPVALIKFLAGEHYGTQWPEDRIKMFRFLYHLVPRVVAEVFSEHNPRRGSEKTFEHGSLLKADFARDEEFVVYEQTTPQGVWFTDERFFATTLEALTSQGSTIGAELPYYKKAAMETAKLQFKAGPMQVVLTQDRDRACVVVMFDTSQFDWIRDEALKAIDVRAHYFFPGNDRQSMHTMLLAVTRQSDKIVLTPWESVYQGPQLLSELDASANIEYGMGYCQTWSRMHLETIVLGTRNWTRDIVNAYKSPTPGPLRQELERRFNDEAGKAALPRFVLCVMGRYRDAQKRALFRSLARVFIDNTYETRSKDFAAFQDWLRGRHTLVSESDEALLRSALVDANAAIDAARARFRQANAPPPLVNAAHSNNLDQVMALLKRGADIDIDAANLAGCTPLWIACSKGYADIVSVLLSNGADLDKANLAGATPLAIALRNNHDKVVSLLRDAGAHK